MCIRSVGGNFGRLETFRSSPFPATSQKEGDTGTPTSSKNLKTICKDGHMTIYKFDQWMENERTPAGTCGGCDEPLRHWELATFAQCGIVLCSECAKKSPCRRTKPPNQQPPALPVVCCIAVKDHAVYQQIRELVRAEGGGTLHVIGMEIV